MKKETIDEYVEDYLAKIAKPDDEADLKRQLAFLIRDVDRDTRHDAAELAVELHEQILNLGH